MKRDDIDYYEPRVVRLTQPDGREQFSIRDVYFSPAGEVVFFTEDALSPASDSLSGLLAALADLMNQPGDPVTAGELGYEYSKTDVQEWIRAAERPVLDVDL